eukprot:jgi/Botrbrau1/15353/Bobra.0289s0008.1
MADPVNALERSDSEDGSIELRESRERPAECIAPHEATTRWVDEVDRDIEETQRWLDERGRDNQAEEYGVGLSVPIVLWPFVS